MEHYSQVCKSNSNLKFDFEVVAVDFYRFEKVIEKISDSLSIIHICVHEQAAGLVSPR